MNTTKKLLPPDEQSLLLVSLLFARKHLDEILSFFPEAQAERMNEAKARFLRLEQGPRVTQIILELRRLLLFRENNFKWIHRSWFDHELAKEPLYLRAIIEPALQEKPAAKIHEHATISREQVLQNFLTPFLNTPQRVALFDPVLMRLQSLHHAHQDPVIIGIGRHTLQALGQTLNHDRFNKYIKRNFPKFELGELAPIKENPLLFRSYKKLLVGTLVAGYELETNLLRELGLWLIAIYLFSYKASWHRMIELVLERPLGMSLRDKLQILAKNLLDPAKPTVGKLLIEAMDKSMI